MIYTAPCVMLLKRRGQHPLRGQVWGGWALEIESFLGPVKWQVLNSFKEKGKDSDPEHCRKEWRTARQSQVGKSYVNCWLLA